MNIFKIGESQELIPIKGNKKLWILHISGVQKSQLPGKLFMIKKNVA